MFHTLSLMLSVYLRLDNVIRINEKKKTFLVNLDKPRIPKENKMMNNDVTKKKKKKTEE